MHQQTIEQVKAWIKAGQIKEVITSTNGTRKTIIVLNNEPDKVYFGEEATEVLMVTNRY